MGPRGARLGLFLGPALIFATVAGASAQQTGQGGGGFGGGGTGGGGRHGSQNGPSRTPMPDSSSSPRTSDPEAYDAIGLFSRLCVSTQGDRARAVGIVGDDDPAIEKMDAPLLRGMENGQTGGIGWIIRMPLGDKLLLEFPPDGSCIVRAPRVSSAQMDKAFHNLLDQYAASGQFDIAREGEQTQPIEPAVKPAAGGASPEQNPRKRDEKQKYRIQVYSMKLPDLDRKVQLVLATTESEAVSIQGVLSYAIQPEHSQKGRP